LKNLYSGVAQWWSEVRLLGTHSDGAAPQDLLRDYDFGFTKAKYPKGVQSL